MAALPPQIVPVQDQPAADPLFQAVAKYISTGPNASPATPEDIQNLIQTFSSKTGGRAYIEQVVLATQDCDHGFEYHKHYTTQGVISISKKKIKFGPLLVPQTQSTFSGEAVGVFTPQTQMLMGTIYLKNGDADIVPGFGTFEVWSEATTVYVSFFKAGTEVARAEFDNAGLQLPNFHIEGSGNWS